MAIEFDYNASFYMDLGELGEQSCEKEIQVSVDLDDILDQVSAEEVLSDIRYEDIAQFICDNSSNIIPHIISQACDEGLRDFLDTLRKEKPEIVTEPAQIDLNDYLSLGSQIEALSKGIEKGTIIEIDYSDIPYQIKCNKTGQTNWVSKDEVNLLLPKFGDWVTYQGKDYLVIAMEDDKLICRHKDMVDSLSLSPNDISFTK